MDIKKEWAGKKELTASSNNNQKDMTTQQSSKGESPLKDKKFIAKIIGLSLLGPLGWLPLEGGATTLIKSNLGNLILLILLVSSWYKIARKLPSGWLLFAAFFYYGAFAHFGLTAWIYMGLTGLCLWVYKRWWQDSFIQTNQAFQNNQNS